LRRVLAIFNVGVKIYHTNYVLRLQEYLQYAPNARHDLWIFTKILLVWHDNRRSKNNYASLIHVLMSTLIRRRSFSAGTDNRSWWAVSVDIRDLLSGICYHQPNTRYSCRLMSVAQWNCKCRGYLARLKYITNLSRWLKGFTPCKVHRAVGGYKGEQAVDGIVSFDLGLWCIRESLIQWYVLLRFFITAKGTSLMWLGTGIRVYGKVPIGSGTSVTEYLISASSPRGTSGTSGKEFW